MDLHKLKRAAVDFDKSAALLAVGNSYGLFLIWGKHRNMLVICKRATLRPKTCTDSTAVGLAAVVDAMMEAKLLGLSRRTNKVRV